MGSEQEDLLDAVTVSELLGIDRHSIHKLQEKGFLLPVRITPRTVRYRREDVLALVEARKLGEMDWGQTALAALQARAIARTTEKKVQQLFLMLGADTFCLGVEEDDVLQVYTKICKLHEDKKKNLETEEVLELVQIFMALNEDYFFLVKKITGDNSPWRTFLETAQLLCDSMPREEFHFDKEKEAAYGLLNAARKHLYHVCYFFIRKNEGQEVVEKEFPRVNRYDERIINYLRPFLRSVRTGS